MQPRRGSLRNSPISGVLLTNADIDHALGLILLRQRDEPLIVYATDTIHSALEWIDNVLKPFCGTSWRTIVPKLDWLNQSSLRGLIWLAGRISVGAIQLEESIAFVLGNEVSGKTVLIAPAVGTLTKELRAAAARADAVLFDGTFWSNEELHAVRPGARSAREMNHLAICDGSLEFLRGLPARRKIYTHINNTNPILMPGSKERRQVEQAGIEIGFDGLEITL